MSISKQVEVLRTIANNLSIGHNMSMSLAIERFREAADIIESLSAKLTDMERSSGDCGGGWILCKDRVPTKEECKEYGREFNVTVDANGRKTIAMDFEYETVRGKEVCRWKWRGRLSSWKVIAWKRKPEPYQEP